ncbi:MAG TPA: hypothetical protein PKD78_12580, partial [Saprospiraceae bacterium]|nr:hypothetical protein [Saprospiraceae bacterium]
FCGTLENAQWLGFIAGKDKATFSIKPFNCLNGNGVQVALYNDCSAKPLACDKGKEGGAGQAVNISVDLVAGANYFLLIDGYAGDQCEFSVDVSPKEAVYEPPLGLAGPISGPAALCPGATAHYSVQPVSGAAAYIWSGPAGSMVGSKPLPVVAGKSVDITFGTEAGPICVQAANTCEVNPPCTSTLAVQMLSDAARPSIQMDSVEHLNCTGAPVKLHPVVTQGGNHQLTWAADSSGHIIGSPAGALILVDQVGTYTLLVTNTENGCTAQASVRVGEPDIPSSADWDLTHISCFGGHDGALRIQGVKGGKAPYLYSVDGSPYTSTPVYRYLGPGTHTLILEGADGCTWDTAFAVQEPGPLLLDLGPDTSVHLGQPLHLWSAAKVNEPSRAVRIESQPPALAAWLCDTCRYYPIGSFQYRVAVYDSNGCRAEDARIVQVSTERRFFVPNAFKPHANNERNARLYLAGGTDVERVLSFQIFNRWGKTVFEHYDFLPDDEAAAWDGSAAGQALSPSVFAWKAEVLFRDGAREQFAGDVTLMR